MTAQTTAQVTEALTTELRALLTKYGAELRAEESRGIACMSVTVPAIFDRETGETVREYTEIDFGSVVWGEEGA
jgi:hypothetical protein